MRGRGVLSLGYKQREIPDDKPPTKIKEMKIMKKVLLLLALTSSLTCVAFAQQADNDQPPPDGPPPGDHGGPGGPPPGGPQVNLTDAEKQELVKAHDDAFQADTALADEGKTLGEKMFFNHQIGVRPTPDLMDQVRDYEKKLHAAMIKADADVAPILAKLEAGHHDGPPPPPPSSSGNSPS
jgi:Spy/CpxP family protein refolding chaperone